MQSNLTLSLRLRKKLGETADPSNFAPVNIDALAREFDTSNVRVARAARDLERRTKEIRRHYDTNGKLFAARLLPQFFTRYDWAITISEISPRKEMKLMDTNNNDLNDSVLNSVRNPYDNHNRVNNYVRPSLDNKNENAPPRTFSSTIGPKLSLRAENTSMAPVDAGPSVNTNEASISDMMPVISQYVSVLSTTLSLLKEPPQIDPAAQTLVRESIRAHDALKLAYALLLPEHRSRVLAVLRGI